MEPVEIFIVPRSEVERLTRHNPVPSSLLDSYLAARPGILDDGKADIFQENCRSVSQRWKDFSLFRIVDTVGPKTVVVFPTWLELFLSGDVRGNIRLCLDWLFNTFPNNVTCWHWNHDCDSAAMPEFNDIPARAFILDFNTSSSRENSIRLPFWTIDTNRPKVEKRYKAGFCGYVGSIEIRQRLVKAIRSREGYYCSRDRIPEEDFLRLVGSFRFSLCPRGGGLSSYRFYESIQCGSVPVLFGDSAKLPFDHLDYSAFSVRIPDGEAEDFNAIDRRLNECNADAMTYFLETAKKWFGLWGVQQEVARRLRKAVAQQ